MIYEELISKIEEANETYRLGSPIMEDSEYDCLVDELKSSVSTERFSEIMSKMNEGMIEKTENKIKHPFVLGSLNKLKYEEPKNVMKFINKKVNGTMNVSAKIDGISCRLHYENGTLVQASTRGDGEFGQDITNKIRFVKFVPEKIDSDETLDIRGELVILKGDFQNMSGFANPRNACAGIVNRKEYSPDELANISFISYTILGDKYTKKEQFEKLLQFGFKIAWNVEIEKSVIEDDEINLVEKLFSFATQEFEYDTDGLVLCNVDYRNESKYYPDKCAAFKLNQLIAQTKLVDIEWQGPSKDGRIIPVAILEPVALGGSIIGKATLHNNDFIREKCLAYGSVVDIIKSGDIIPKVIRVVSNENTSPIEFPTVCPCCGTNLVERDHWMFCPNTSCEDQTTYQVQHFLEKLGIENVSFKRLQQFGLFTIDDLLKFVPDENYKVETKLYEDLKTKLFSRSKMDILSALNFEGVSTKILKKIFDFYGFDVAVKHENLSGYPVGVGEKILEKFLSCVDSNMQIVERIASDPRYSYVEGKNDNILSCATIIGSICFTGSLNTMGRKEASNLAERNGFEVKNSITKGLTYLVTNNIDSGSSKAKKAKEQGTTVINEEEFLRLMNSNGMNVDDL